MIKNSKIKQLYDKANEKAGRNIFSAILVGLLLGIVALLGIFVRKEIMLLLILIVSCFSIYELYLVFKEKNVHLPIVFLELSAIFIAVFAYLGGSEYLFSAFILSIFICTFFVILENAENLLMNFLVSLFALVYIPTLLSFTLLFMFDTFYEAKMFYIALLVVVNDTFAYVFGRTFGKHKFTPKISPNKTWEGFIGGILSTIVASYITVDLIFVNTVPQFELDKVIFPLVFAIVVSLASTLGDLCESLIKRNLNKKDMSNFLFGHGGFLDRVDSFLFVMPITFLFFQVFF